MLRRHEAGPETHGRSLARSATGSRSRRSRRSDSSASPSVPCLINFAASGQSTHSAERRGESGVFVSCGSDVPSADLLVPRQAKSTSRWGCNGGACGSLLESTCTVRGDDQVALRSREAVHRQGHHTDPVRWPVPDGEEPNFLLSRCSPQAKPFRIPPSAMHGTRNGSRTTRSRTASAPAADTPTSP